MKKLIVLFFVLFSTASFGESLSQVVCETTDATGKVQIDIAYTITTVREDLAYLDSGSHLVKLQKMVIGGIKTPFFIGEDSQLEYTYFSGNEDLLFLKNRGSEQKPVGFRCQ